MVIDDTIVRRVQQPTNFGSCKKSRRDGNHCDIPTAPPSARFASTNPSPTGPYASIPDLPLQDYRWRGFTVRMPSLLLSYKGSHKSILTEGDKEAWPPETPDPLTTHGGYARRYRGNTILGTSDESPTCPTMEEDVVAGAHTPSQGGVQHQNIDEGSVPTSTPRCGRFPLEWWTTTANKAIEAFFTRGELADDRLSLEDIGWEPLTLEQACPRPSFDGLFAFVDASFAAAINDSTRLTKIIKKKIKAYAYFILGLSICISEYLELPTTSSFLGGHFDHCLTPGVPMFSIAAWLLHSVATFPDLVREYATGTGDPAIIAYADKKMALIEPSIAQTGKILQAKFAEHDRLDQQHAATFSNSVTALLGQLTENPALASQIEEQLLVLFMELDSFCNRVTRASGYFDEYDTLYCRLRDILGRPTGGIYNAKRRTSALTIHRWYRIVRQQSAARRIQHWYRTVPQHSAARKLQNWYRQRSWYSIVPPAPKSIEECTTPALLYSFHSLRISAALHIQQWYKASVCLSSSAPISTPSSSSSTSLLAAIHPVSDRSLPLSKSQRRRRRRRRLKSSHRGDITTLPTHTASPVIAKPTYSEAVTNATLGIQMASHTPLLDPTQIVEAISLLVNHMAAPPPSSSKRRRRRRRYTRYKNRVSTRAPIFPTPRLFSCPVSPLDKRLMECLQIPTPINTVYVSG